MYEVLVSHLRECAKSDGAENTFEAAAEAIERLEFIVKRQGDILAKYGGETGINDLRMFADRYWDVFLNAPRWTPVTKKLPEKNGRYFVMGRNRNYSTEYWACQFADLGGVVAGWINDASRPVVEAWMEIPIPPESLRCTKN